MNLYRTASIVIGNVALAFMGGFVLLSAGCSGAATGVLATRANIDLVSLSIPLKMNFSGGTGLGLTDATTPVASNVSVEIAGCSSGFSLASTTLTGKGDIKLFREDRGCKVKVLSFQLGTSTYAGTFVDWTAGSVATFANTVDSSDTIKVTIVSQLTQSGVLPTDTVTYTFEDIIEGSTPPVTVVESIPLSVTGNAPPDIGVAYVRFFGVNANGSASLAFTLNCTVPVSGTGSSEACDGVNLTTNMQYMFVPDTYGGNPTFNQAVALFAGTSPSPTAITTATLIAAGGTDDSANVIPNGGFYTGNSSPIVTGTVPIYPDNLNYILFVEELDGSLNPASFIYFQVQIASITQ